ncbi:MAG: septation protein IspZ [Saccharospirillaceae bacterium]|nr:septation protein IspZ [Saccharospirillaceae bacterium]
MSILSRKSFFGALLVSLSATSIVLIIQKIMTGSVSKMNLISAGILLALGLPSIIFQNDILFKIKTQHCIWFIWVSFSC